MTNKCCICLNAEDGIIGKNCFKCYTCLEGYVCNNCISEYDPRNIFDPCINCPCCKTTNWKYHFNKLIKTSLGDGFIWNFYFNYYLQNKSLIHYMKYYDPAEYAKIQHYNIKDICNFCNETADDNITTKGGVKYCLDCVGRQNEFLCLM